MLLVAITVLASAQVPGELPETMQAPASSPDPEAATPNPEDGQEDAQSPLPEASAPVPEPAPRVERDAATREGPGANPEPEDDAAALACHARLKALGVDFAPQPPVIGDEEGCVVAQPVVVSSLAGGVKLEPEALLSCPMAEATATFVRDTASPAAERHLGAPIAIVHQASGYVCRPRHGTDTLSEHASGNALDWAGLTLADETVLEMRAHGPGQRDRRDLLREIRGAACGHFTTVLGPGTDADHADHLHFDLAERASGSAYCR